MSTGVIIQQVIGQALAFAAFLLILKKYAWGPLLSVIDERNAKIESDFHAAEEARREAHALKEQYEERMRSVEAEGRAKIQTMIDDGRRVVNEMTENARVEARKIQDKAIQVAELETAKARIELTDEIVRMTLSATEKLIREKMDEEKHRRLVRDFVEELSRQQ